MAQHPQRDPGVHERGGRVDEGGDPEERGRQVGVGRRGGVQAVDVGAQQPGLRGPAALDPGKRQVAADRQLPRRVDDPGDLPVERRGLWWTSAAKLIPESQRLEGRDGHALPVDRVEAAEPVAHHEEPLGKPRKPFVATADTGREPERHRVGERHGGGDGVVDVGLR